MGLPRHLETHRKGMIRTIKKIKTFCLYLSVLIVMGSNIVNCFFVSDRILQWRFAMISISAVLFLMTVYLWLNETLKRNGVKIILTGWSALYLLFNLIGVAIGYNLHTKGFMAILFITTVFGIGHLCIRSWRKYM